MDSWGLIFCHASWMGEPRPVRHRWTTEEYPRLTSGLQTHAYTHSYTHKLKRRSGKRTSDLLFAGKLEELTRPHVFCCLCDDFPYCVFTMICTAPPLSYKFKVLWGCFLFNMCSKYSYFIVSFLSLGPLNTWRNKTRRIWTCVAVAWFHLLSSPTC